MKLLHVHRDGKIKYYADGRIVSAIRYEFLFKTAKQRHSFFTERKNNAWYHYTTIERTKHQWNVCFDKQMNAAVRGMRLWPTRPSIMPA